MTTFTSVFHAGEIEVQRRAGVRGAAEEVGSIIADRIPDDLGPLLAEFRLAVAASIDARGRVWASLLSGPAGFLKVTDESRLLLDAQVAPEDPLRANLAAGTDLGLLVLDPATRRRLRFNGRATLEADGSVSLSVRQVYGNCRKYIQRRLPHEEPRLVTASWGAVAHAPVLTPSQQDRIAAADTFFIGSAHPEGGADASHRGGKPGFVQVAGASSLSFPDYAGNNMFNTLGNLSANPRAGLLFVDFERGDLLQLAGRARLVWDPATLARHRGARHVVVEYEVDEVLETRAAGPLRWTLVEPSPFNP